MPRSASPQGASRRLVLGRIVRFGFPLLGVGVTLLGQVAIPRLLQLELSEGAYTAYIAVTSIAAYIGLADGGLLIALIRELSALHGAGDRASYVAEAERARRIFAGTSLAGGAVAAALLGSALEAAMEAWSGASSLEFRRAAMGLLAATTLALGCGSYHTAMLYSTGRLLAGQVVGLTSSLGPLLAFIFALSLTRDLNHGLWWYVACIGVIALLRVVHAETLLRREAGGVSERGSLLPLHRVLGAGLSLKAAEVLPVAAYPHALSVVAPGLVPAAIPARTYANACRIVSQQFLNLLQVHITRRVAGDAEQQRRGRKEYEAASSFLCSLHLLQVAVATAAAGLVFSFWLPNQKEHVDVFLSGMLAEQALLAAALPSSMLFIAYGDLTRYGLIRLAGVAAGLTCLPLFLSATPRAALGLALTVSALPLFTYGLWSELTRYRTRVQPTAVILRYLLAGAAALSMVAHPDRALWVATLVGLCGAVLLPGSVRRIWFMLRQR